MFYFCQKLLLPGWEGEKNAFATPYDTHVDMNLVLFFVCGRWTGRYHDFLPSPTNEMNANDPTIITTTHDSHFLDTF